MLMAHPAVLRDLVTRYDALRVLHAGDGCPEIRRRMDDAAYTLCVTTGTRDVTSALAAARQRLSVALPVRTAAAGVQSADDSLIGG
ncbi:DUF5133 domain-containing protein [Streptomyces tropicalis]|uniref:DUF5133 domain-containing protein n=1 Tax=Streptomyces tropicalis TaxID=3034234 RepID=A0ABT6A9H4_9ACTN|nr:DUF5133 domain-containing protein [Streptomyces tropicalis]MDF3301294.1 DUF5133 domain-containing protein [Streptomyces tropicalis]